MRRLLINNLIVLSALLSVCWSLKADEYADAVMTVTVTQAREGTLSETLNVYGKTVPRNDVSVATNIDGVHVIDVFVEEGEYVSAGQELARLDPATLQYSLDALRAELEQAEKAFSRAKKLQKAATISQEDVDIKRKEYLTLLAQTEDARLRLRRTSVVAPAAGVVYQRNVIVGEITQLDEPLFKIAANAEIELEVTVPEDFTARITLNTRVEAELIDENVKRLASIRYVSPRIDPANRTAKVRLNFPSSSFIPVNLFCSAQFILPETNGLILVNTALQQDRQGDYVWLIQDDNSVTRKSINVIARYNHESLIEGIEENQYVVARAGSFLQEGDRILTANIKV